MCQFIESISYLEGKPKLLAFHQERMDRTYKEFFSENKAPLLEEILPEIPDLNKHKCRVMYDEEGVEVEFIPYTTPSIHSLQVVESNNIDYTYKSLDRNELSLLFAERKESDDIMIIKEGKVTDSYFANLVFFDGEKWLTPQSFLLNGVQRQYLLNKHLIEESEICLEDLDKFKCISLINAMNDLGDIVVDIKDVFRL